MSTGALAGSVVVLGLAGSDRLSALLEVPALAAGAKRRVVMPFSSTVAFFVFTVAAGLALGESVSRVIPRLQELGVPDWSGAALVLSAGAGLGI